MTQQQRFDKNYMENDVFLSDSKTITFDDLIVATISKLQSEGKDFTEIRNIINIKINEMEKF